MSEIAKFGIDWAGIKVWYVGKHGNNSYDGKSHARAKLTFGGAAAVAAAGDLIFCVDAGTYAERVNLSGFIVFAPAATIQGGIQVGSGTRVITLYKIIAAGGSAILWPAGGSGGGAEVNVRDIDHSGGAFYGVEIGRDSALFRLDFGTISSFTTERSSILAFGSSIVIARGQRILDTALSSRVAVSVLDTAAIYLDCPVIVSGGTAFALDNSACLIRADSKEINSTELYNVGAAAAFSLRTHTATGTRTGVAELRFDRSAQLYFGYDSTGGVILPPTGVWVNVPLDVDVTKDRIYGHNTVTANDRVTINDTGSFAIDLNVGIDVAPGAVSRNISQAKLQFSTNGGLLWTDMPGTLSLGYNRAFQRGYATLPSFAFIHPTVSGWVIRAQARQVSLGIDDLVLYADVSRLRIQKIRERG